MPGATTTRREQAKVIASSLLVLILFLLVWHLATRPSAGSAGAPGGAKLSGPAAVAKTAVEMLRDPFYDHGPNDKGIGIQLIYSLGRAAAGYGAASICAIFFGVVLGLHPLLYRALNPYIQILKPISPLAWMPLFLYTIRDAGKAAVLVIFMSSLWPTLANTAFGVSGIKRDYWNVSSILQLSWFSRFFRIILPAAAPAIVAGLRISMGSAWIAIVAAEMLVGGTGIGYFVWNEWNNFQLASVIFAILVVGLVGVVLDSGFVRLSKAVSYAE